MDSGEEDETEYHSAEEETQADTATQQASREEVAEDGDLPPGGGKGGEEEERAGGDAEFVSGLDNRYVSEDVCVKEGKVELTEEQVKVG